MFLNVRRLVSNGDLGKTWQINQSQTQDVRRVHLEVDGLSVDALVRACDPVGLIFNLPLDFLEIVESAAGDVVELSPLVLTGDGLGGVRNVDCIVFGLVGARGGNVDELQDKRSPCYDAATAREKVTADNVLEDGGFSGGLGADGDLCAVLARASVLAELEGGTNNLREIQRIIADGVEDQVLQLVDHAEQVFSKSSHSCGSVFLCVGEVVVGAGEAVVSQGAGFRRACAPPNSADVLFWEPVNRRDETGGRGDGCALVGRRVMMPARARNG